MYRSILFITRRLVAGFLFAAPVWLPTTANASVLSYDFSGTITSSTFTLPSTAITGAFTYDNSVTTFTVGSDGLPHFPALLSLSYTIPGFESVTLSPAPSFTFPEFDIVQTNTFFGIAAERLLPVVGTGSESLFINFLSTIPDPTVLASGLTFNGGSFHMFPAGGGALNGRIDLLAPSPVPGPIVGAGLPGLVMAFGGLLAWRRRKAASVTAG